MGILTICKISCSRKYLLHFLVDIYTCIFTVIYIPVHCLNTIAPIHALIMHTPSYFLKPRDRGAYYVEMYQCIIKSSALKCQKLKIKKNAQTIQYLK